ncbi:MAG: hypothetical protein J6C43_02805 [Oscillospiraceae bacterium]|nr:hypothetical protein [Oscillospiraceae bacterium]MBP3521803.1 hypothetical protein [Oscillospiraceae bacterium]
MKKRENAGIGLLKGLSLPVIALVILLGFAMAVNGLDQDSKAESKHQLEQAIRRGCVACYAAEGVYPPNLDYLKEHYGLQMDEENYVVYYDIFAENLMPDITVLEVKK